MSWKAFLENQAQLPYFITLQKFLEEEELLGKTILPPKALRFNALKLTPLDSVKVVILGQDPYHGVGQSHGLSFSVPEGVKVPPSLRNIYKELAQSIPEFKIPESGNLEHWAKQGVLMINSVWTVEKGLAGSHAGKGWETFTDNVISEINNVQDNVIFLLWGSYAQKKSRLIDLTKHNILTSVHPSPLSAYRGFFGCNHFNQVNDILIQKGKSIIHW
ncbi:uracil-DNA glycosylase [Psychromonas sp. PT13]|uniref:uracil-DNA glycosylase n=1 Tax=Psychromonas sp. PT13 TaxID=3439547 RepID=UPI003EBC4AE4